MGKVLSLCCTPGSWKVLNSWEPHKVRSPHVQESTPALPHTQTHKPWHTPGLHASILAPSPGLYRSLQSGILCFPQRQPSGTNLGPSERAVFPDVGWRSSSRLIPKSPVLTSSYVCSCGEWFLPLTSQSHWRVGVEGRYLDVPDPVSQTVPKHWGHTYSVAWEADLGPD